MVTVADAGRALDALYGDAEEVPEPERERPLRVRVRERERHQPKPAHSAARTST